MKYFIISVFLYGALSLIAYGFNDSVEACLFGWCLACAVSAYSYIPKEKEG